MFRALSRLRTPVPSRTLLFRPCIYYYCYSTNNDSRPAQRTKQARQKTAGIRRAPSTLSIKDQQQQVNENSKQQQQNQQQQQQQQQQSQQTQEKAKEEQLYNPCSTVSTCERYDLSKATGQFFSQGMRSASVLLPGEMVHVKYPYEAGKNADVLVLSNGTIVAWGMPMTDVLEQLVPLLKPSEVHSYRQLETEDMDFVENIETPAPSTMTGDVMHINGSDNSRRLLNKAAFSGGLARNTKVAALEISLEKYIATVKEIGEKLATGGDLGLKGSEVLKITGQLLQIRGQLNLYSELIETPDLYWSEPELESLYSLISRKLDIGPRIAILNKKLDYASELVSILKTHTSEEQSTRLEWYIILLIMVEVCFEVVHFAERYWFDDKDEKK